MKPIIVAGVLGAAIAFCGSIALFNYGKWCASHSKSTNNVFETGYFLTNTSEGPEVSFSKRNPWKNP